MTERRLYKKRHQWDEHSERFLINIWQKYYNQLRSNWRNFHLYNEMSQELTKHCVYATALEVKLKIGNMTTRYKKENALIGQSGESPSDWPHYKAIHEIIGSAKSLNREPLIQECINDEGEELLQKELSFKSTSPIAPSLSSPSPIGPLIASSAIEKYEQSIITSLKSTDVCIKALVEEFKKSNAIEQENVQTLRTCTKSICTLAEELKTYLRRQP